MDHSTDVFQWPEIRWPWRKLSREFKLAFLSACGIGLIVHLYVFTNLLLGNDAANNTFHANNYLTNGRWALGFFSSFSTFYQMPVVIGLISIVMIALTAGLTVKLLELSHPAAIVITSALLVSFPSVANTFAYMFTADPYFIALFMNTLAVWLTKKYRFGWIAAVGLITLACGIYQAYICYAAGLLLFDCTLSLLKDAPVKQVLRRGIGYAAILIASLLAYILITNLLLRYHQQSFASYRGMDTMGQFDLSAMLSAIPTAYRKFILSFIRWPYSPRFLQLAQFSVPLLFGGSLLYLTAAKKLYREPLRLLLGLVTVLLLPLALDLIAVLNYSVDPHLLMIYAFVLFFVFTVKLAELAAQQLAARGRQWAWLSAVSALCCCVIVWNNFCVCNVGYHALQTCYENTFSTANRIVARIEELDGYTPGDPVAMIGSLPRSYYGIAKKYGPYSEAIHEMNQNLVLTRNFIAHYIGLPMPAPSAEQKAAVSASELVASMPAWPAEGCTAMIDGVAVVRLGEGEKLS